MNLDKYIRFRSIAKEYIQQYEDYMSYCHIYFEARNKIEINRDLIEQYKENDESAYEDEILKCEKEILKYIKIKKTFKFKDKSEFKYEEVLTMLLSFYDNFNFNDYVKDISVICVESSILYLYSLYLLLINIGMKEPKWYMGLINFYVCDRRNLNKYFSDKDKKMNKYCNEILMSIVFKNTEYFEKLVNDINNELLWLLVYYHLIKDGESDIITYYNKNVIEYLYIVNRKNNKNNSNFIEIINTKYHFSNFDLSLLHINE